MIHTYTEEIEFIVNPYEFYYKNVEFFGEPIDMERGEDAGEYWGIKYPSTIVTVRGCEGIEWERGFYTDKENEVIDKYLENHYDHIDKNICGNE